MKLHSSVIDKLLRIYELHGGRRDNVKLLAELNVLDVSVYKQKTNDNKEEFVVLTETIQQARDAAARGQR